MASIDRAKTTSSRDEKHWSFFIFGATYARYFTVSCVLHTRYSPWISIHVYFWAARGISTRTTNLYPRPCAGSRFWLVNSRETQRRIARLTLSAWNIKTKERHWWRHNVESDRRPLSLPLQYDRVALCLYGEIGQINGIAGVFKLRKDFRMW